MFKSHPLFGGQAFQRLRDGLAERSVGRTRVLGRRGLGTRCSVVGRAGGRTASKIHSDPSGGHREKSARIVHLVHKCRRAGQSAKDFLQDVGRHLRIAAPPREHGVQRSRMELPKVAKGSRLGRRETDLHPFPGSWRVAALVGLRFAHEESGSTAIPTRPALVRAGFVLFFFRFGRTQDGAEGKPQLGRDS